MPHLTTAVMVKAANASATGLERLLVVRQHWGRVVAKYSCMCLVKSSRRCEVIIHTPKQRFSSSFLGAETVTLEGQFGSAMTVGLVR